ncbi:MAG TPA: RpiB/LacA/LacB family sugar-phosphate isomerase [Pyrinomonadaceae bacterium]|jgi:ribose 5-phosphate isomerase B
MPDNAARDRIRALVRDVLDKAAPLTDEPTQGSTTSSRFVDTIPAATPIVSETTNVRDESSKSIITEDDVKDLADGAVLRIGENARLTPLAADIVSQKRIEIVRRASRRGSKTSRLIAVGADHGGFKMKEELKTLLTGLGHRVHDFGTNSEAPVDYPDVAYAVARSVSEGQSELGIVIDGAGVGSAMTANKVPGVRAAACYSVAVARNSREHNGANVLSLGSKTISSAEMREIVQAWLATEITEERHLKRVGKIEAIERQYLR